MNPATVTRANAYAGRLAALRGELEAQGWAAVLVLDGSDIAYLTGLHSTNAVLVVTPREAFVATDFRYVEKASSLGHVTVHQVDQALFGQLGKLLGEWTGGGTVAYAPTALSHRSFLQLTEELPESVMLRSVDGVVSKLREVKNEAELDAIRNAASLLTGAYELVASMGIVGRPESDVAWAIEQKMREGGATAVSFPLIVASGTNGALPHHSTAGDVIPASTLVTVDIGCVVDGYCSDATRTFATGPLSDELQTIYDVTLRAQVASLAAVRPGAIGKEVDAIARDIITDAGYGERFGHGLGHGVGIEVHEGPRLAKTSNSVLETGMVVTVEPGIYVPGVGGVRIEDLVIVTEGAPEVLTDFTKELLTIS